MFSSTECTMYLTIYFELRSVYNMRESKCLVQMSVQYTGQYMFNSNECTIYLTVCV